MFNCLIHGLTAGNVCPSCAQSQYAVYQPKPFAPTLRQYYAAKAMQGFCANNAHQVLDGVSFFKDAAKEAFEIADALINFEEQGE